MRDSVYTYTANRLTGEPLSLHEFAGKVLLIVNTASACGFTPQYRELEALHRRLHARGFAVIAFPCNQFGRQEPGSAQEIGAFCDRKYSVTFPLFEKIHVNGAAAHPLYRYLKSAAPGIFGTRSIKWNFTKFLVDREGRVVRRYSSMTKPSAIAGDIESLLA